MNSYMLMIVDNRDQIPKIDFATSVSQVDHKSSKVLLKWVRESEPGDVFMSERDLWFVHLGALSGPTV